MTRGVRFVGPVVVAATGIAMCAWSWDTWPDPVIDFGREIYVPWRLAAGEVLYRDIVSYFNGPLSPYAHAALFAIFGESLRVLVTFNLVLVALLAGMLYWLIRQVAGELAATVCGVTFFVLFAFAQFLVTGNYNYVCPYSYELTHGITLTAAGIVMFAMWLRDGRATWLAGSGLILGLVALTKAEVLLAAGAALGTGLIGELLVRRTGARAWAQHSAVLFGAAAVPPLGAFALLSIAMPPGEALRGMLGAWRFLGQRELTDLPYFRQLAGTDDIPNSIATILLWTLAYAALLAPGIIAARLIRSTRAAWVASVAFFAVVGGIGLFMWPSINWNDFVRPAPLVLLTAVGILAWRVIALRERALVLPLVMVTWALAMLAKIPLNAHIYHYGFALAMPATLMLIVIFIDWLPRLVERGGGNGWPVRATVAAALLVTIWAHLHPLSMFYGSKTIAVAGGADRFRADARGVAVNALLGHLRDEALPGDTLVVLPEGLLVNYLARMPNPTGQLNFTPPAIIMYGEGAMLDAFRQNPPDWIAVSSIDTAEYGPRFFGVDYAQALGGWIAANYRPVATFSSPPVFGKVLEIRLLRRATATTLNTPASAN